MFTAMQTFRPARRSDKEVKELAKSIRDLLPLSEQAILLKVKISLLEKYIAELEGKQKRQGLQGVF